MARKRKGKHPELEGFVGVDEYVREENRRIFLNVRARGKCGKTHFLSTAKRPVAYYDIDKSAKGVVDQFSDDEEFHIFPVRWDPDDYEFTWDQWLAFKESAEDVAKGDYFASICVDTQDELMKLQRTGYFEGRKPMQIEYGAPNTEFQQFFKSLYNNSDKNVLLSTKMRKEYKGKGHDSSWTGGYEPAGNDEMEEYIPECCVELYRFRDDDGRLEFGLQVDKLRVGVTDEVLGGEVIEGRDLVSFPYLMTQVFTDSEEEEWT